MSFALSGASASRAQSKRGDMDASPSSYTSLNAKILENK